MHAEKERILLVEDERVMRTALEDTLAAEGYRVLTATDGATGLERALKDKPSLVLLDIMLPKLNGLEICAELRRLGNPVPVLMLTARAQLDHKVAGLDAGADDYLIKPFQREELLARIRALLRRTRREGQKCERLQLGDVEIDFQRQTARRGEEPLHLTAKEFAMLKLMALNPGEPISRERFLDAVWGYTVFPTMRTVDNYINLLRTKLERDPEHPRWIQTVRAVGYRLSLEE